MTDYMKEAERLSRTLEDIAQTALRGVDNEQIRGHLMDASALLAHFQRGAVPEGVGAFRHKETGQVRYTLTGGEHDEDEWEDVLIVPMLAAAPAPDHFRGVTKMVPAPAEVPMPEPDTHCYDEDERRDVWSHSADQMLAYGVACRAAGEAAGYARGLADERERCASVAWAHYMDTCRRKGIGPDVLPDWCCAAALRGEVKP